MTVCFISTESVIISIIAILAITIIIMFLVEKKWKTSHLMTALYSIGLFVVLFFVLIAPLSMILSPPCGGSSTCEMFEYNEDGTCKLGHMEMNSTQHCDQWKLDYEQQQGYPNPPCPAGQIQMSTGY